MSSLRSMLESSLGGIEVRRTLPAPFGGVHVWASGRLGGLKFLFRRRSRIDPLLLVQARRLVRPGDTVWDVGANVGWFAAAAAWLSGDAGRVVALEADSQVAAMLLRTAESLPSCCAPITVLPVAAGDTDGLLTFEVARRARAANSLAGFGSTQAGGIAAQRTVPAMTLDRLSESMPRPDVLKIDVEGAEALVLRGARALLREHRPLVLCEVSSAAKEQVAAEFGTAGYELFDAGDPVVLRHSSAPAWDCIGIPAEKVGERLP